MNLVKDTVIDYDNLTHAEFYLSQNYPNPFRERTSIKFCIPYRINMKIEVFGNDGILVKKLIDEEKAAGSYQVELDASGFLSGKYSLRIYTMNLLKLRG